MQGMQRKQRGHEKRFTERRREAIEKQKNETDVQCVKHDVVQMMSGGFESEHLHVRHVRHPRQRMPVTGVELGECPFHGLGIDSLFDVRILGDVIGIIKRDEAAVFDSEVGGNRKRHQNKQADEANETRTRFTDF